MENFEEGWGGELGWEKIVEGIEERRDLWRRRECWKGPEVKEDEMMKIRIGRICGGG